MHLTSFPCPSCACCCAAVLPVASGHLLEMSFPPPKKLCRVPSPSTCQLIPLIDSSSLLSSAVGSATVEVLIRVPHFAGSQRS